MRYFTELLLILTVFITTGCSQYFFSSIKIPNQMKTMVFDSSDPNSPLSCAIRNKLYFNGIKLIEKSPLLQDVPLFHLLTSTQDVISAFQDSCTVQNNPADRYQIIMSMNAEILISNHKIYPINIKIYRSFFNDSQMNLVKDSQQQTIINEMYDEIAEELIRKLSNIQIFNKETFNKKVSKKNNVTHRISTVISD